MIPAHVEEQMKAAVAQQQSTLTQLARTEAQLEAQMQMMMGNETKTCQPI